MDKSDEELMLAYQEGKSEVLDVIFSRYQKKIFNFSLRFLGNRADAEDMTADVFLHLMRRKNQYQPQAKFCTWLYTVARNACLSKIRQRQNIFSLSFKNNSTNEEQEWDIPDPTTPADELQKKETALHIKKAVQNLPPSQKEVILLREFHNLSYDEISKITGHSLENVKVLIFRARDQLRQHLATLLKEAQS